MAALHFVADRVRHIVAQVVEAEFVVRAVGDVCGVLLTTLHGVLAGDDHAGCEAEHAKYAAHDVTLVLREVVVDRHDMDAFAGERIEVCGQGRDEGLAFTGLHFGDFAAVECSAAHELHGVGALAECAACGFANGRESCDKDVVERLAVSETLFELVRFFSKFIVGEFEEAFLDIINALSDVGEAFTLAAFTGTKDDVEKLGDWKTPLEDLVMHARVRNTLGAVSLRITARTVPVYVAKGVRAPLEHPDPLE